MDQILTDPLGWLLNFFIWLPGILVGLTFHEYAHGLVASWLGDPTPAEQGRLTLNPLPHIDWVGFLMLALFHFGWAKPVEVDPRRFTGIGIKKGMMLVSLAGPAMNMILAVIGLVIYAILSPYQNQEWGYLCRALVYSLVIINAILAVFNLIPVPPLDGSKILAGVLPDSGAHFIYSLERYGFIILLILIFSNVIGFVLGPVVNFVQALLQTL